MTQENPDAQHDANANANDRGRGGLMAWFATNHVAANLLMLFILIAGGISLMRLRYEVFQEIDLDLIRVTVPYPGASPKEIEESICVRVEEAIRGIEGIEKISSTALEGSGVVIVELHPWADDRKVLDDVEQAVDLIRDFPPEDAEDPDVILQDSNIQAISIVLYGDAPERTLKELAEKVRDDLTTGVLPPGPEPEGWLGRMGAFFEDLVYGRTQASKVEISGVREYEIGIGLSEEKLRKHGLTFSQVADIVRRSSVDLPGGAIETRGGDILLRTQGKRYTGQQFQTIPIITQADGSVLRLGDLAVVEDGFTEADTRTFFDYRRAVTVEVFRVGQQGVLGLERYVKQYVERTAMPGNVKMETWRNRASVLRDRANLLIRNAVLGLILVFLCLALFLDLRLAFWTTLGIPISFMGAFVLMGAFGVSINMISLFALIIVLGLVVDDAIVVGENVYEHMQRGEAGADSAVRGVSEMALPVTLAVATSIAAFLPLIWTEGDLGKILWPVSAVVCCVLLLSLVEALMILPAHLSGRGVSRSRGPIAMLQHTVDRGLRWVINTPYTWTLNAAARWRYLTLAIGGTLLLLTLGLIRGGIVPVSFLPQIGADRVVAQLEMPQGTPVDQTLRVVKRLEEAAEKVRQRMDAEPGNTPPGISAIEHVSTTVGSNPEAGGGPGNRASVTSSGSGHLAGVTLELAEGGQRNFTATEVARRWRKHVGEVPGVSKLSYDSKLFDAGESVFIQLTHEDFDLLIGAADRLKQRLAGIDGVTEIADSFEPGKRELKFELTQAGLAAGLRLGDLGRQVRQAFFGEEAQRIQRGRDDIKVMVRYPLAQRRSLADIQRMRIRLPDGTEAPLEVVARVVDSRGYATIDRVNHKRVVNVTADVDEKLNTPDAVNALLRDEVMPELGRRYPDLTWTFEGAEAERQKSQSSLRTNMAVALMVIYAMLAVLFRSYFQPLIVMSAIPFGLVGAVAGHWLLGLSVSLLSGFGIVALTGVVVNDSLIMIDLINRERKKGRPLREVVLDSGRRRFRPILLTTLTTFFGLLPMIFEQSLQAKFLIPMAVSLAFGVLFATVITLILVPSLYLVLEDLAEGVTRLRARLASPFGDGKR